MIERTVSPRKPRILIADSNRKMLDILRDLLKGDYEIVAAVTDGEAMIRAEMQRKPDLIITDVNMPRVSGIKACQRIRDSGSQTKIMFLSVDDDPAYRDAAFEAGGSGWLTKTAVTSRLKSAIHVVLNGGIVSSQE